MKNADSVSRNENGTIIYQPHLSYINEKATIGAECVIHAFVWLGPGVKIGDRCKVQAFSFIPPGVTIGDDCFIGPRVTFLNDSYPPSGGKNWKQSFVGDGAVIGGGAVILPGVRIAAGAKIGAGAVVTKDVPCDGQWWVGNPARPLT